MGESLGVREGKWPFPTLSLWISPVCLKVLPVPRQSGIKADHLCPAQPSAWRG